MISNRQIRRAFTIIELLVAVVVTMVMLFLINTLFTSASDAVSLGVATSDIIGNARAIGQQLEEDATNMCGPFPSGQNAPGFLVIFNKKLTGVPYDVRRQIKARDMRTDQLSFLTFFPGKPPSPICPSSSQTFNPPTRTQMGTAVRARVWYGHVLKTDDTGATATAIGAAGTNRIGTQLAIGRQALYLLDRTYTTNGTPNGALAIAMAAGATYSSTVQNIGVPGNGTPLYKGYTDVADFAYQNPLHPNGTMFGDDENTATSANKTLTLFRYSGNNVFDNVKYQSRALNYTFVNQPLWANPAPRSTNTDKTKWFTSAEIAQMHPILADQVSDFIVDFAGDYVDDSGLNVGGGRDGVPDTTGSGGTGNIIWYSGIANSGSPGGGDVVAFPSSMPSWIGQNFNPQVSVSGGTAFVFRHDLAEAWPYLIRVRYRLHDRRGDLGGPKSPESDGTQGGKWFEQIIVVPR